MNRRPRPSRLTQQMKEEQINFLLEDVEKHLEEYKKAVESRDNYLTLKKFCKVLKKAMIAL